MLGIQWIRIGAEMNVFLRVLNTLQHWDSKFKVVFFYVNWISKIAMSE